MRNLLETVTRCIDSFSQEKGIPRFAAIIGGEAIILHGIPRTTLGLDILLFCEDAEKPKEMISLKLLKAAVTPNPEQVS